MWPGLQKCAGQWGEFFIHSISPGLVGHRQQEKMPGPHRSPHSKGAALDNAVNAFTCTKQVASNLGWTMSHKFNPIDLCAVRWFSSAQLESCVGAARAGYRGTRRRVEQAPSVSKAAFQAQNCLLQVDDLEVVQCPAKNVDQLRGISVCSAHPMGTRAMACGYAHMP